MLWENLKDLKNLSPMMKQYVKIKKRYKKHLLFFRLGDFYELFFDDAITASKELEIALTARECGLKDRAPMCGVPHKSSGVYIKKLMDKGFKVAICEQVEQLSKTSKIMKRDVVRIITPGTVVESDMLSSGLNNYICSIYLKENCFSVCFADISTGTIQIANVNSTNVALDVINELERFSPVEILYNEKLVNLKDVIAYVNKHLKCLGELIDMDKKENSFYKEVIEQQFKKIPKEVVESELSIKALGELVLYLKETQKDGIKRLVDLIYYEGKEYMKFDAFSRRNLELTKTLATGQKQRSLFWILNKTKTSMGERLLRKIIEQPLIDYDLIVKRHEAVEALCKSAILRDGIINILAKIYDLERLMTKVVYKSINPRELKSLSYTFSKLPLIKDYLKLFSSCEFLKELNEKISDMKTVCNVLENAIVDEPPANLKDGEIIKSGFHDELDKLKEIKLNGKEKLIKMEEAERKKTKINKLKISYNKIFGYFIEVTKANLEKIPKNYIRKQTLSSCERFITKELKEYEEKILTANEKIVEIEQKIFEELKDFVAEKLIEIQQTAKSIAMLDVLCCFSLVSQKNRYVRPKMTKNLDLKIKNGRHPVVESLIDAPFVTNDTVLDDSNNNLIIITGPNMAGKSTYMRQVAVIVLMAQIGCFVPADSAEIGVVDRIFTRVGACDDLSMGKSTFMMEIMEVVEILKNATNKSLIILDEIGRGTSTFDGISIAKSIAEYILTDEKIKSKTLFATHYFELTSLEDEIKGAVNYNVAVEKKGDNITFLRKIVRGRANNSYGIAVAKMAGIPKSIIKRANFILKDLKERTKNCEIYS